VRRPLPWWRLGGAMALLVAVPVATETLSVVGPVGSSGSQLSVAVVQGSVPDRGLAFEDRAEQVLDNHVAETLKLAREIKAHQVDRPDLVVWPENASDVDPLVGHQAAALITKAVRAVGVPVLVGAILNGPGPTHRRNAGILWSPTTGPGAEYIKRHPVPFAEYMPLRSLAEKISSAAKLVTQDMVAGTGNGLLRGGPAPLGDVICFEVAYDGLVQSSVRAGAQLVVVQTNNATFGHTSETYQQLAMSRLRAIETGRTVLQASTTGISAIIDPTGHVVAESDDLFAPAILTARVDLETAQTDAVQWGAVPEWVLAGLAVAAALASIVVSVSAKRRAVTSADTANPTRTEMAGL
jgi:apolipoprotein N-acyltransferase